MIRDFVYSFIYVFRFVVVVVFAIEVFIIDLVKISLMILNGVCVLCLVILFNGVFI